MRIYLVRHGETTANLDKAVYINTADHAVELSPLGHKQAKIAGAQLANIMSNPENSFSKVRVWSSPYERTRQTAKEIMNELSYVGVDYDYREHINLCEQQYGLFDGIPDNKLSEFYPDEAAHYDKCERHNGKFWARMPLGESRFDVAVRVHQAFGSWHRDAERHGIRDLIVVTHGVTLRAIVMQWMHLTPEWFEAEKNPSNCAIRLLYDNKDFGYI